MRLHHIVPLVLLTALASNARAQSGGVYDLSWSTIDSGGAMKMSGGAFTLSGSVGQFDAGDSGSGHYDLNSGFWPIPFAMPTEGCNDADLGEPYGTLDFTDVVAFLGAFGAMDPIADLAPPLGVFDFTDVVSFLTAFGAGCP